MPEITQEEIDAKVIAINEAIGSLIEKADLTAYKEALNAVVEEHYTKESWTIYQAVVEANQVTEENTQEEVDTATTNIKEAQDNLVFAGLAELDTLKEEVANLLEEDYTSESWTNLQSALNLPEATNEEILAKISAVADARNTLTYKNQAALDAAKEAADNLEEELYTSASWIALQEALGLPEGNNAEMGIKATAITEAINNLAEKADLTAYKTTLAAVEEDDYTVTSWTIYQGIVNAVENQVSVEDSQEKVDSVTAKIKTAQENLVKKADLTEYQTTLDAVEENDYTEESWTTYQEVVQANKVTGENTQAEVDEAIETIEGAQKDLVFANQEELDQLKITVEGMEKTDYTDKAWNNLQDTLALEENSFSAIETKIENLKEVIATMNLEKAVTEALKYEYSPSYKYIGEAKYTDRTITRDYPDSLIQHVLFKSDVSNDMARTLGALYYINEGNSVEKIIYDNQEYTWKPSSEGKYLKGSNWRVNDDDTLVKKVVGTAGTDMIDEGTTVTLVDKAGYTFDLTFKATFDNN